MSSELTALMGEIRACRICEAELPLGPRPVLRGTAEARLLIAGQAPGTRVHESGVPWDDASGERLRDWLALTPGQFYDETRIAIVPMGFCYPGRNPKGGDLPPRRECAENWHARLLPLFSKVRLILLVGQYAQNYYLGARRQRTMTETVRDFEEYGPIYFPLPHPSWRTVGWQKRNPWFDETVLPALRERIADLF